jgi:hypothetical protein
MNVRIFRPSKTAMQSGRGKSAKWVIEAELESARVPEPLMGWISSEDTLNQLRLRFATAEEAVSYAQKHGWSFTLDEPQERQIVPRSYSDNFKKRQKAS